MVPGSSRQQERTTIARWCWPPGVKDRPVVMAVAFIDDTGASVLLGRNSAKARRFRLRNRRNRSIIKITIVRLGS